MSELIDNLIKDIGDCGISYDEPLPEAKDFPTENAYRTELAFDLMRTKNRYNRACMEYAQRPDKRLGYWAVKEMEALERRLEKLTFKGKIVLGKAEGISPEKIAQARQYKLTDLIKTNHGMAICPFHNDKRASMDVRKNFYYCYGCNASGDVIDFYQKLNGVSFREAINALS